MTIIDYFKSENRQFWIDQLLKSHWSAATILTNLLKKNTFHRFLGCGSLYMLVENKKIISFATLTTRDCIADEKMHPWIGYVFTYPNFRGHRYSQYLIDYLLKVAKTKGNTSVYLATEHIGLYEKYGFLYLENRIDIWGDENRIYYKSLI